MSQANQFDAISAPLRKLMSDSISMALEGFATSQTQTKKLMESVFELAAANLKDSMKYAEELRRRVTEATNAANELMKEQAALFSELPKDPVAASQKVISGYVEGSRKALDMGAEALRSYVNLVNDLWTRLERSSQETRENYLAFVGKLQELVESAARKS